MLFCFVTLQDPSPNAAVPSAWTASTALSERRGDVPEHGIAVCVKQNLDDLRIVFLVKGFSLATRPAKYACQRGVLHEAHAF